MLQEHPYYADRKDAWERCRAAYEGAEAIRARMMRHRPNTGRFDFSAYPAAGRIAEAARDLTPVDEMVEGAPYYPAFGRTLEGLTGVVMRQPPTIESATVPWEDLAKDVDGRGTNLEDFTSRLVMGLFLSGRAPIVLHAPQDLRRVVWRLVRAESVPWWLTDQDGMLEACKVMEERVERAAGVDELKKVKYVRTFRRRPAGVVMEYGPEEQENVTTSALMVAGENGGGQLQQLPVVLVDLASDDGATGLEPPKPPMLDLADLALSHYQTATDLEHALHWAGSPQPWIETSRPIPRLTVGPSRMLRVPPGSKVGMLETASAAGIKAMETAIERKSRQMAAIGGRLIDEAVTRHAETAAAVRLKSGGDRSLLGRVAAAAEAGIRAALRITAEWERWSGEPGTVSLTREWIDAKLDPDAVRELVRLRQTDEISHDELMERLRTGEVLPRPPAE